MKLLEMSNEYCLDDLQKMCEVAASKVLSFENIGRFMALAAKFEAAILQEACKGFVHTNKLELKRDEKFRQEIEENSLLGLLILDFFPDEDTGRDNAQSSIPPQKRQRVTGPVGLEGVGPPHDGW